MSVIYTVKSYRPSPVTEFMAAMKRQDIALAKTLGNPKLKLFEKVWKSELLALPANLEDRESTEKTDVVLIFSRKDGEGKEEEKGWVGGCRPVNELQFPDKIWNKNSKYM